MGTTSTVEWTRIPQKIFPEGSEENEGNTDLFPHPDPSRAGSGESIRSSTLTFRGSLSETALELVTTRGGALRQRGQPLYLDSIFQMPFQSAGGEAISRAQRAARTRLGPSANSLTRVSKRTFASEKWPALYSSKAAL